MFTVYETSACSHRNSEASVLTSYSITSSPLSVSYKEFEKKSEIANASKYWKFQDGIVVIIELPNRPQDIVDYIGLTTCHVTPGHITRGSSKQLDSSFVPRLLPKPAQNLCDVQGNP
ncbi:892_t:CDS:2 [Funneliformis geosporum]|uniref:892_t:CDS:1 n=1 Tax=Funneliformis geosporum TaxID=1117311 RepID=A0A9W4SQL8_9GLOM|nr:892_t:CDS:2 [Funneliformis geosporum]